MDTKGYVLLRSEFKSTTLWPGKQMTLKGEIDLEIEYKKSLAGKLCHVMDIGHDESYLVIGESSVVGTFMWIIEKDDVRQYLPFVKKGDYLVPAGLSPIEEYEFLAKLFIKHNLNNGT